MSEQSYPVTDKSQDRGEQAAGQHRAAPPPSEVSKIVSTTTVVLTSTAILTAALFLTFLLLAQLGAPAATATMTAAAGGVVVLAGIVVAVRQIRQLRSLPVADLTDTPDDHGSVARRQDQVSRTLSRRLQSLIDRVISEIQSVEEQTEDPGLLRSIFVIDHQANRTRRLVENLTVVGGGALQHPVSSPMPIANVLRSATAETEHYPQIMIMQAIDVHLQGYAVAEVVHLLAELMENATTFSDPESKVAVRATKVAAGVAIDIADRGPGIPPGRLPTINALLDWEQGDVNLDNVVDDGHIGLIVVRRLASRYQIKVRLQTNIHGGIDAAVVLPSRLLVTAEPQPVPPRAPSPASAEPRRATPRPGPRPQPRPAVPDRREERPPAAMDSGRHAVLADAGQQSTSEDRGTQGALTAPRGTLPRRTPTAALFEEPAPISGQLDVPTGRTDGAPELPQRVGTYLHPALLRQPSTLPAAGAHNPTLFADARAGRQRSEAEPAPAADQRLPQTSLTTEGPKQ